MITIISSEPRCRVIDGQTVQTRLIEARGKSTDTKPTERIENGSTFIEVDTGTMYFYDGETGEWLAFEGSDE